MRFKFGDFVVDDGTRQLLRNGRSVHLSPKGFDLLVTLIRERPHAISKSDLHAKLWPATYVSDASLAMLIAEVRAALGETARDSACLRTLHRHGYAFQAAASEIQAATNGTAGDRTQAYWLITSSQQFPLVTGENIIGRDPNVNVWLDSPSVSRRHARIRIDGETVTVEDLGSKNGTVAREVRVTKPTPIADGDELRVGSVTVTLRGSSADLTQTEADA